MKAFNIDWDTDGDNIELPSEIDIPDGMTDEDEISDYISNVTGFCHYGFELSDQTSKVTEDIKYFLFGSENEVLQNSLNFEHGLQFVSWVGNGSDFIVADCESTEYRISIKREN